MAVFEHRILNPVNTAGERFEQIFNVLNEINVLEVERVGTSWIRIFQRNDAVKSGIRLALSSAVGGSSFNGNTTLIRRNGEEIGAYHSFNNSRVDTFISAYIVNDSISGFITFGATESLFAGILINCVIAWASSDDDMEIVATSEQGFFNIERSGGYYLFNNFNAGSTPFLNLNWPSQSNTKGLIFTTSMLSVSSPIPFYFSEDNATLQDILLCNNMPTKWISVAERHHIAVLPTIAKKWYSCSNVAGNTRFRIYNDIRTGKKILITSAITGFPPSTTTIGRNQFCGIEVD